MACIPKIDFFMRYYILIIIETFYNYYLINKETDGYPNMKYNNIKIYYYLFLSHLKEEKIIPNEEIFLILRKLFGNNFLREKGSFKGKVYNIEMEIVDYKQQDLNILYL